MTDSKLSERTRAFYLRALRSLDHPEAFSLKDLVEAMFDQPTYHRGTRKDIPTGREIGKDLPALGVVSRLGKSYDGTGRQYQVYSFDGGPRP